MGFLGLLGRGRVPGSDGPNGFIGQNNLLGVLGFPAGQASVQLRSQNLFGPVRFSLGQGFSHADNGADSDLE